MTRFDRIRPYELVCLYCNVEQEIEMKADHLEGGIRHVCPDCFGGASNGHAKLRPFVYPNTPPGTPNLSWCKNCSKFIGDDRTRCDCGSFVSRERIDPFDMQILEVR